MSVLPRVHSGAQCSFSGRCHILSSTWSTSNRSVHLKHPCCSSGFSPIVGSARLSTHQHASAPENEASVSSHLVPDPQPGPQRRVVHTLRLFLKRIRSTIPQGSESAQPTGHHALCLAAVLPFASSGTFWADITHNVIFMSGFWGWFLAQLGKVPTNWFKAGRWDWSMLVASGGMPSSHSSLCMSVTTAVGMEHGFGSSLFAMATCFSLIVMYDAAGVRRHAGTQAEVLNTVVRELLSMHAVSERKLKEVLGHTPLQVFMGAIVGIITGVIYPLRCASTMAIAV